MLSGMFFFSHLDTIKQILDPEKSRKNVHLTDIYSHTDTCDTDVES